MQAFYRDLTVTRVEQNGWGALVTAEFLDKGAFYGGDLKRRAVQFMVSRGSPNQPLVGQALSLDIKERS